MIKCRRNNQAVTALTVAVNNKTKINIQDWTQNGA